MSLSSLDPFALLDPERSLTSALPLRRLAARNHRLPKNKVCNDRASVERQRKFA
jgi:hypothetical protein